MATKNIEISVSDFDRHELEIDFEFDWGVLEDVKDITGRQFDDKNEVWHLKLNERNLVEFLSFCQKYDLTIKKDSVKELVGAVKKKAQEKYDKYEKNKELATKDEPNLDKVYGLRRGKSLYPFQRVAVEYVEENKKVLIGDQMGIGKDLALDCPLLTPNGWEKMENINVGDLVIGNNGKKTKVTGTYPQGKNEVFQLTFSDGATIKASGTHQWSVRLRSEKFRGKDFTKVKTTKELYNSELRDAAGNKKWFIPIVNPVKYSNVDNEELPIDPYLLGLLLGDGSLSINGINFTTSDKFLVNEVKKLISENSYLTKSGEYDYIISHKTYGERAPIHSQINELNLIGQRAHTKFIPQEYKHADVNSRLKVLQGLFDTDGTTKGSGVRYSSTSEDLCDDVQEIVRSLGGTATKHSRISGYTHNNEKKKGKRSYRLYIRFPNEFEPFQLPRKKEKLKNPQSRDPTRSIEKIEKAGKEKTKCISVATDDNLYVAKDFIVTHNTIETLGALEHLEKYPALIVCPASLKENWKNEVEDWLPSRRSVNVINASDDDPTFRRRVIIINYALLEKYKDTLLDKDWKMVVADESHYCFPYRTKVKTDKGTYEIGKIVEEKIGNKVLSYNFCTQQMEWKRITDRHEINNSNENLIKIKHENGELTCSENHKIYSITRNKWIKSKSIQENEELQVLQKEIQAGARKPRVLFKKMPQKEQNENKKMWLLPPEVRSSEKGKEHTRFLLKNLWSKEKIRGSRRKKENCKAGIKSEGGENNDRKNLQTLRRTFQVRNSRRKRKQGEKVLFPLVRPKMEDGATKTKKDIQKGKKKRNKKCRRLQKTRCFKKNEAKEPRSRISEESETGVSKVFRREPNLAQSKWWKRSTNRSTKEISKRAGVKRSHGTYNKNRTCKESVRESPSLLRSRHNSLSTGKSSSRSGWELSQVKKMEVFRPEKRKRVKSVRVESIKVLERGGRERDRKMQSQVSRLYDISVKDNQNYYANNVLVHNCKNEDANRTQNFKEISEDVPYKLLLSGTPITNRPSELISQLKILDVFEEEFGGWWEYVNAHCDAHRNNWGWDISGASNLEELHEKLISTCYIRRNKEDVLDQLPEKSRKVVKFDIENRSEYRKVENNIVQYFRDKALKDEEFQEKIENLPDFQKEKLKEQRVTKAMSKAIGAEHLVKLAELRKVTAKGKLKSITNWIDNFLKSEEKLILFAHHTAVCDAIEEKYDCLKITGEGPSEDRQGIVEKFQNDPEEKLIILNIAAGGEGITLTAASHVAFIELPWSPAAVDQAEARAHRLSQEEAVNIYYLLANDTIDEKVHRLIEKKRKVTSKVNAGKSLTEEDLNELEKESDITKGLIKELLEEN